jgi:signal transduction histidine kinase
MKVCLISKDEQLYWLCYQCLAPFAASGCELALAAPGRQRPDADLRLWDVSATLDPPPRLSFADAGKDILLVDRRELALAPEWVHRTGVPILLKPVQPVVLRSFLFHAAGASAGLKSAPEKVEPSDRQRDELLQCLLRANLGLQEYDQDRTHFLAQALHDFRTPLSALRGYCGLMLENRLGPLNPDQADLVRRMQHSVKRLSRLTQAMFLLSVSRQVENTPKIRVSDIGACLDQAMHEIRPLAFSKGIDLQVQVVRPVEPLYFDPEQMEQVFVNLLENACKFTPPRGVVAVQGDSVFWERRTLAVPGRQESTERRRTASRRPNAFQVDVRDSGPGIHPKRLEEIFEEYRSSESTHDRSGAGLGLAICKRIVQAHRGRIFARSEGTGATFSCLLPFPEEAAATLAPRSRNSSPHPL